MRTINRQCGLFADCPCIDQYLWEIVYDTGKNQNVDDLRTVYRVKSSSVLYRKTPQTVYILIDNTPKTEYHISIETRSLYLNYDQRGKESYGIHY